MDWNDVRIFLALARAGSLSAAARQLGVEHSTVARRIEALEQALKLRLFDRLPRGWQLTAEGERLSTHAERMAEDADGLLRDAAGAGGLSGTVRLSAPPAFATHYLVPRLARRQMDWPGITLEVIAESRSADLTRREADLAVRLSRPEAPDLAVRPLAGMGHALYAHPDYLASHRPEEWVFLGYEDGLRHVPQQRWLEKIAAGRPFALRSNELGIVHQGVRAGLGVSALPHFLGAADPALARLSDPPEAPAPTRDVWLVLHPDLRRSPRVRRVADEIAALIETDRVWLETGASNSPAE